jgi:hypothetical protein
MLAGALCSGIAVHRSEGWGAHSALATAPQTDVVAVQLQTDRIAKRMKVARGRR